MGERKMKYSIKKIANLLGISIEAVRNYEKCGLIEPQRNEQNNYRKYNAIDLNVIRRARSYMSYGFSLAEATDMLLNQDLFGVAKALEEREAALEKQLMLDYQILQFTKNHAQYLTRISAGERECAVEMSPAFYGLIYREKSQFFEDEGLQQRIKEWNDIRPFAETFIVYAQSCFQSYKAKTKGGICIEKRYASFFGICEDEYVRYYPPRKAIHTIIPHVYEPDMDHNLFEFDYVARWAEKRDLTITDDAFGRVLHTSKASGTWKHYMEMWVPID